MTPSWKTIPTYQSKYIHPDDLTRPYVLTISAAQVRDLRQYDGTTCAKIVLRFDGARKALPLNKTQCMALEAITGTDDYTAWPGTAVQLAPGRARNGKPTIVISAPPASKME